MPPSVCNPKYADRAPMAEKKCKQQTDFSFQAGSVLF